MDAISRSRAEEIVNSVTHGIGLVLSLAGSLILLIRVLEQPDWWRLSGCAVFATALVTVYAASTLSHAVTRPAWRQAFRTLDQGCIYLLIVGTFTPFALEYLRVGWWWLFLLVMWAAALIGFVSKLLFWHRVESVAIWSYVLLGWLPIVPAWAFLDLVPLGVSLWILVGGLCYTAGTIFLVLDHRRFHFHAVWHLFVIAGSVCHFWAVFAFIACAPLQPS
ncbi:MAG: hemolysin III family protein [Planctomycetaceae bacterium]|nr:hemolysin III family protein [Planctomycetaceae bacterium]